MGLFDFFKKKTQIKYVLMDFLNGRAPVYNQFGESITVDEVVQDCMFRIVSEMKKLRPMHVKELDTGDITPQTKTKYHRALQRPNPLMSKSDFIEKITWNLLLNHNSFIYPMEVDGVLKLYPLQPTEVEFVKNEWGVMHVRMRFASGYEQTLPYEKLIHIRYRYALNEFMGGNKQGKPDTQALGKAVDLNNTLMDGLKKQLKMNMNIVGVAKMKTMQNMDSQLAMIKEFEKKMENNEGGILPMDITAEYIPINSKTDFLDAETLKFIEERIYRPFGLSRAYMSGDYTKEQKEAVYETALEHLIISYNDAFTKGLFTEKELGYGNQIVFFSKALQFASMSQKIEVVRMLGDAGTIWENEKRITFGWIPQEELVGVRMMSKNYGTVESVQNMDMISNNVTPPTEVVDEGGNENE